jgi:hypothetical protein
LKTGVWINKVMAKPGNIFIDPIVACLKKSRFTWIGSRKQDKYGEHYTSVLIEKSDGAFVLNVGDTVQMESPDDDNPFVGVVLRLYEANYKKMIDVEWFFTKDDVDDIAPKNHKSVAIEEKEVFLAEGEVEIVDNMLGLAKQPCYIVYLTPQESKLPENKRAMAKARDYFPLYFCRHKLNEQDRTVSNIGSEWTNNEYVLSKWSSIPEGIRHFLQHETAMACFRNPPRVDPNATTAAQVQAARAKAGLPLTLAASAAAAGAASFTKTESSAVPASGVKAEPSRTSSATMVAQAKRRASAPPAVPVHAAAPATTSAGAVKKDPVARARADDPASAYAHKASLAAADAAANALTKEQVLSMDVYDLAQRVMFDELVFSSSDNQTSSSDEDGRMRRFMPGVIKTKGRSSLQKRQQYRSDKTYILHKWSDLNEKALKSYFLKARALKDRAATASTGAGGGVSGAGPAVSAPPAPAAAAPASVPKLASLARTSSKEARKPAAPASVASAASVASSGDESSEDDFADIKQDEFSALLPQLRQAGLSDGDLAYKLFCYERDQYASSSSESDSESSDGGKGGARRSSAPKKPRVRTAEELAERARKREARRYHEWTDLSLKRMKTYITRAQRLRQYYNKQVAAGAVKAEGGLAPATSSASAATITGAGTARGRGSSALSRGPTVASAPTESLASDADEATVAQVEDIGDSIMQAVRAGLGKYEIALKLLAADLSKELLSSDEEEVHVRGRKEDAPKDVRGAARGSGGSVLTEMSRVVEKFNSIPQRTQSAYMKRAAELQAQCGVSDSLAVTGASGRNIPRSTSSQVASSPARSPVKQRRPPRHSLEGSAPSQTSRSERDRLSQELSRKRSAPAADGDSSEGTRPQLQRRRRGADFQLMEGADTAPASRRSSDGRGRFSIAEEASRSRDRDPPSSSGSEDEDGGGEGDQGGVVPAWRILKKMKEEARKESYRQRTEKLRQTIERKKLGHHPEKTERSIFAQPVHALIPTMPPAASSSSDSEGADVEEIDEEEEEVREEEARRPSRARGKPVRLRSPPVQDPRRRRSAPELAVATNLNGKRPSDWVPEPEEAARRRPGRPSRPGAPLSSQQRPVEGGASDIEEYSGAEGAPASSKRRRGRPARGGAPLASSVFRTNRRQEEQEQGSPSELVSVDSAESGSDGENSLSEREAAKINTPIANEGYGTRGRARQSK